MTKFEKGHAKLGGRKKGVKNRNTEIKERIAEMVGEKFDDFVEAFDKLPPKPKCALFIKLVEFVVPKVSAIKFEEEDGSNSAIELLRLRAQYKE